MPTISMFYGILIRMFFHHKGVGSMKIKHITVVDDGVLQIVSDDERTGLFDVRPYMESEAFRPLKDRTAFAQILNGGYYVEWRCGADLSADTIEARWDEDSEQNVRAVAEDSPAWGA